MERRFIEENFPVKEISEESSKEKSGARHGHISTLHIWWARRPLAASRATIFASLIPATTEEKKIHEEKKLISELSLWKNSLNKSIINKARKQIFDYNQSIPKVLDPFSGGGSIPLEALRLGCETYAIDYNPVASLIVKATLETPFNHNSITEENENELKPQREIPLISEVKKWSKWVLEETKKEISSFFPDEKNGDTTVGYLWSRSIPCQNPKCEANIPLMRQFWLANKPKRKIALFPEIINKKIQFKIVGDSKQIPKNFDPKKGTISRGTATCLVCGYSVDGKKIKKLFEERKNSEILNAVIVKPEGRFGKHYRVANKKDVEIFKNAQSFLKEKIDAFQQKYGIDPIPNEPTPEGKGTGAEKAFLVRLYNMNTWGELYNDRQKLALLTFLEKIQESYKKMLDEKMNSEKAKDILLYLGIIFDRLVDKNSNLVIYHVGREKIEHVFGRPALGMVWDYVELNPFTKVGWENMENWVTQVLEHLSSIDAKPGIVKHSSATNLPFTDGYFDAVITDPPYYDNIPYSYLSDFFYVWLKRTLGFQFTDLFSTPLTPKKDEIVTYSNGPDGWEGGKTFFEKMLKKSFQEIHRVLKPEGITVIVYAHKSTEGWETLINSLLESGLVVTAAWPIHTEMKTRLRAADSAALASSIYMVARKWEKEPIGFYRDVKSELRKYLNDKLERLWKEGISGADFFIAAIGTAIEVFGRFEKIIDDNDNKIETIKLLNDVRKIVTDYAINRVIKGELSDKISQMTRFYILWRWAYGGGGVKVQFDDALKMAQSVGIDLEHEWNKGFIIKEKEFIRVLGPNERKEKGLEESHDLIDILHNALLIWKKENRDDVEKFLEEKGYKNNEVLKRIAQAISESLPMENTEKNWLDGFLTGFNTDNAQSGTQSKLF